MFFAMFPQDVYLTFRSQVVRRFSILGKRGRFCMYRLGGTSFPEVLSRVRAVTFRSHGDE